MAASELIDAASLVPHQAPFRLVDRVLWHRTDALCCSCPITLAEPFLQTDGLPAHFGMEMLAQASAALFTLNASDDGAPRQGMLIACQSYSANTPFYPAGGTLIAEVALASPMPKTQGALVKFSGELRQTPAEMKQTEMTELDATALRALPVVSTASLSVYL